MTSPSDASGAGPLVFLSHASEDEAIALLVAQDLLGDAFGLRDHEVFCTSEVGSLKFGVGWEEQIRAALEAAPIAFFLITPSFVSKPFCIAELGAVWVQRKPAIALIAHGGDSKSLPLMLKNIQAARLDNKDDLTELRRQYSGLRKHERDSRWEKKRDEFLAKLKEKPSPFVSGVGTETGAARPQNLADILFGRRRTPTRPQGSTKEPIPVDPNTGRVLALGEPVPPRVVDEAPRGVAGLRPGSIGAQIVAAAMGPQPDFNAIPQRVQELIRAARERVFRIQPFTCKVIMMVTLGNVILPVENFVGNSPESGVATGYAEAMDRGELLVEHGVIFPNVRRAHVEAAVSALRALQEHFAKNDADRRDYELAMNSAADIARPDFWRLNFNGALDPRGQ